MTHSVPEAPFTTLHKYVKASRVMRNIEVLAGARNINAGGSPSRVVMFPVSAPIEAGPDDGETLTDALVTIECHCWGQDHDRLWDVIRRLLDTVRRYRLDQDIEVQWSNVEFGDVEPGDDRDGDGAVVNLIMRSGFDFVNLTGEGEEGDVEAVRYQPDPDDSDAYGPTINQTE